MNPLHTYTISPHPAGTINVTVTTEHHRLSALVFPARRAEGIVPRCDVNLYEDSKEVMTATGATFATLRYYMEDIMKISVPKVRPIMTAVEAAYLAAA